VKAEDLLQAVRREAAHEEANRLVPLIATGRAALSTVAELGAEEHLIVASDRRSFLFLAARADQPDAAAFFTWLGQGEGLALAQLPAFTTAAGMDPATVASYLPRPGCQAYPAYLAWLALNAEPAEVILALLVNFAAWGGYCATVGKALREHYGFDDAACGFLDFFASPAPEMEAQALAAVQYDENELKRQMKGLKGKRREQAGVRLKALEGKRADITRKLGKLVASVNSGNARDAFNQFHGGNVPTMETGIGRGFMPRTHYNTEKRLDQWLEKRLGKGYPEYDPEEERGPDGRWRAGCASNDPSRARA